MALSDKTVRSYLDFLTGTFMVRQLQPWQDKLTAWRLRNVASLPSQIKSGEGNRDLWIGGSVEGWFGGSVDSWIGEGSRKSNGNQAVGQLVEWAVRHSGTGAVRHLGDRVKGKT